MHLLISKKKTYYLFLFFFLVSINNFSILNLNFPKIEKIEISGVNITESKKIKKIINDLSFENIFLINKSEIRKKILSLNNIEQLRIFKNYPSTLKIDIKKTKFLALTKNNGLDYFVGSNGKLIQKNDATLNLPFIFGDLNIQEFLKLKNKIDNSNFEFGQITNFYFFKSKRWDIKTSKGIIIKLPKKNVEKTLNLFVRLSEDKNFISGMIIDFRQENQIIINEK
tara:strand:+ start:542 stop:1216 length:675 start_codon:yes stop_codon:yes gene_type:complete